MDQPEYICNLTIKKDEKDKLNTTVNSSNYQTILKDMSAGLTAYESVCAPRKITDESKITFRTHFVTFVSQAITGVLFPFYKDITDDGTFESFSKSFCINKFHDLNVIPVLYVNYINECWDKYNNKQNDEIEEDEYDYVIVKLDKIKKSGKFKHNYCLIIQENIFNFIVFYKHFSIFIEKIYIKNG